MRQYLKISIVTPSFNQGCFIKQTIDSVLNQNYPNLEYIVMDGGSNDGTVDILKSYGNRIIWKSEKDKGQSDAINKGMAMATGEILGYINSDDLYTSNCFFKINDFFLTSPKIRWAYGKCRIIDEHNREVRKLITAYKNFWMKKYSYNKLLSINFINQPSTFWRKEIRNEFGLFNKNEHLVMDYEYWLRIGKKYRAGFINAYLSEFRMYTQSKSFKFFENQFKDELRLAKFYSNKKPSVILLHYLNYLSIISGYNVIRMFRIWKKIFILT